MPAFVRRYKDLNTDLDALHNGILKELQAVKEMSLTNDMKGKVNDRPFRSVTAVRASVPRVLVGALREITVTTTGTPNDYVVEVHTGSWFNNLAVPGTAGMLIAGPFGAVVGAGGSGLLAANYQRTLSKKVRELVEKNSKNKIAFKNVENFP